MATVIKVFKKNDDYVCEIWGASTKHPDSRFEMLGDQNKEFHYVMNDFLTLEENVYQWLLFIASVMTWKFSAKDIVDYANKYWYDLEEGVNKND